jgi:hypothetical protein
MGAPSLARRQAKETGEQSMPKSQVICERNDAIRSDYMAGKSRLALAAEYGVHPTTIANVVRDLVGKRPEPRRGRRANHELKVISPVHRRIGARVWEITHDRLDRELTRFATELRMSNTRLSKLQQGLIEISISDLLKIALSVGRPVEELFLSREAYDDLQRGRRIRTEEGDRRRVLP